jgi:hypothetical protein
MKRLLKRSSKKTTLYHGTSSVFINNILQYGLLPEGYTGNAMFVYNDYNRKGKPKHQDCVYLTNSLSSGKRYAANAVKNKSGFPIVLKVLVSEDSLTWDDDAFYKKYKNFDFGEKDVNKLKWNRKPEKELWQQSLDINQQCSHYGIIEPKEIISFLINGKWLTISELQEALIQFDNLNFNYQKINENKKLGLFDYSLRVGDIFDFEVSIINRNIYLYNVKQYRMPTILEKICMSIKIMQFLKENIGEFGATVVLSTDFKTLGFKPESSVFNYVFGVFKTIENKNLIFELKKSIKYSLIKNSLFQKTINGKATKKEFDFVYDYSVDFVGELISYCENVLGYDINLILKTLTNIQSIYEKSKNQIIPEIKYLKNKYFQKPSFQGN